MIELLTYLTTLHINSRQIAAATIWVNLTALAKSEQGHFVVCSSSGNGSLLKCGPRDAERNGKGAESGAEADADSLYKRFSSPTDTGYVTMSDLCEVLAGSQGRVSHG